VLIFFTTAAQKRLGLNLEVQRLGYVECHERLRRRLDTEALLRSVVERLLDLVEVTLRAFVKVAFLGQTLPDKAVGGLMPSR
jgi:hypothetical protein